MPLCNCRHYDLSGFEDRSVDSGEVPIDTCEAKSPGSNVNPVEAKSPSNNVNLNESPSNTASWTQKPPFANVTFNKLRPIVAH